MELCKIYISSKNVNGGIPLIGGIPRHSTFFYLKAGLGFKIFIYKYYTVSLKLQTLCGTQIKTTIM